MQTENFKRYFQFFLVVIAAGAIFPIVYLRTNYQETILEVFNLSLPDLNNFYSVLGMTFVVGYIPSGLLSDRFSAKWLLAISLLGTAICGFWFGTVPDQSQVRIIFLLWGFFTVFTFWSAHMKMVKMLARANEEGRFFGIMDGGRGVVEAVMGTIGLAIFASILGTSVGVEDKTSALVAVINLYSAIVLATAVLVIFFVDSEKNLLAHAENSGERAESEKFQLSKIGVLLKNGNVFLMGSIIFMGYAVFWTVYYLGGFLQTNVGVDAVTAGTVTAIVLWMRPVGGFVGGFLADRFGRAQVICCAMLGAASLLVVLTILPVTSGSLFYVVIVALGAFLYAIRGTYWSLLGQCGISVAMMGTAIGVISFVGYLPDIILPQLNTFLWNTFGDTGGYNAYFIVSAGLGVVGAILALIHARINKPATVVDTEIKPVPES
ncbi:MULTISPECIES: MFS transporter [Pseudovibrio]|uniref:MFS transporter n=1 Tax=Stappiaceae TaxID=2821832 RepID=UPI002365F6E3|nr:MULTISPECIES: MFS transporter [Pseudovibrio]MDD7911605.1 MFS transporter [Pseudovibrio exalbescens]MDX5594341.1 MFS transporter [Pseudovibrio sp. SPO723]